MEHLGFWLGDEQLLFCFVCSKLWMFQVVFFPWTYRKWVQIGWVEGWVFASKQYIWDLTFFQDFFVGAAVEHYMWGANTVKREAYVDNTGHVLDFRVCGPSFPRKKSRVAVSRSNWKVSAPSFSTRSVSRMACFPYSVEIELNSSSCA